jgi:hypothetical protein
VLLAELGVELLTRARRRGARALLSLEHEQWNSNLL